MFCPLLIGFSSSEEVSSELSFAKNLFNILYNYDTQAASYAMNAQSLSTNEELLISFQNQTNFVDSIIVKMSKIYPPSRYSNIYQHFNAGLSVQKAYLNNITQELKNTGSFDKAFLKYNNDFFKAQTLIQSSVKEFKDILFTYDNSSIAKILSSSGLTPEKLQKDVEESEYVRKIQESLN
jgi:hypothetical protein